MTNQNPAAAQSLNQDAERDRLRQRAILAKVNAHADRSMDRLFADIDVLLNNEPETDRQATPTNRTERPTQSATAGVNPDRYPQLQQGTPVYPPQSDFTPAKPPIELDPPQTKAPQQGVRIPLWLKVLMGAGIASIAGGSLLFWLVTERKIVLPNIDTSWVPFQSQSQATPEDLKFADYMRKSIAKIEAAPPATTATTIPNPANNIATAPTPSGQTTPTAINPTLVPAPAAIATTANPVKTPIALVKTLKTGDRPSAIFQIDGKSQTINVGQKIGTSNWSLLTVSNNEVMLKKAGGEIRSIRVGQKF
jgi:Tfp pilus assembly protein PilP